MKLTRKNGNQGNRSIGDRWHERSVGLNMFDDFLTRDFFRPSFSNSGVSTPSVNIVETSDDFRIEMVAPGMKKEAFNIELDENIITIAYDHEDNREGERHNLKYIVREYNYHSFSRKFSLPETADTYKIQARYRDGILNVTIPKREEARGNSARQIKIA